MRLQRGWVFLLLFLFFNVPSLIRLYVALHDYDDQTRSLTNKQKYHRAKLAYLIQAARESGLKNAQITEGWVPVFALEAWEPIQKKQLSQPTEEPCTKHRVDSSGEPVKTKRIQMAPMRLVFLLPEVHYLDSNTRMVQFIVYVDECRRDLGCILMTLAEPLRRHRSSMLLSRSSEPDWEECVDTQFEEENKCLEDSERK